MAVRRCIAVKSVGRGQLAQCLRTAEHRGRHQWPVDYPSPFPPETPAQQDKQCGAYWHSPDRHCAEHASKEGK